MKRFIISILLPVAFVAQIQAATIWSNAIEGPNPSASNAYTDGQFVVSHLNVSGIGRSEGISGVKAPNEYCARGWETPSFGTATPDLTNYFYFVLTPENGFPLNLSSFVYSGHVGEGGPTNFTFRSSLDNFASDILITPGTGIYDLISLTGAQYQGLTSAIEFRFYAFGTDDANGAFGINDFYFTGDVVPSQATVPESGPGLAAFAGILLLLALAKSRGVFSGFDLTPALVRVTSRS
jgi:hypothetical protein